MIRWPWQRRRPKVYMSVIPFGAGYMLSVIGGRWLTAQTSTPREYEIDAVIKRRINEIILRSSQRFRDELP